MLALSSILSNSCQSIIIRNVRGYPAISSHRGISIQIWVPVPRSRLLPGYFYTIWLSIPRSQLSPGYFRTNMGACTPQPTFTGVFLRKYGCLYPAANFYRGISTQIWVPVPRSQLSPGYFRTNTGAYTPQSTFTGVFLYKYGRLYPSTPAPLPKLPHPLLQILHIFSIPF